MSQVVSRNRLLPGCFPLLTADSQRAKTLLFWRVISVLLLLAAPTICSADSLKPGSWFVDMVKYHVSAHGQTSCQDCHPDVIQRSAHPDPSDVTRTLKSFFNPDTCYNCHDGDSIKGNLEKGLHAGRPIKQGEDYSNCIACHDPHYQPRLSKKTASESKRTENSIQQCAGCHEAKQALPQLKGDDAKCAECHKAAEPKAPDRTQTVSRFCLECHSQDSRFKATTASLPLIDADKHILKAHSRQDCMSCHTNSARFEHHRQSHVNCRQCHTPHHEAVIHDAHAGVTCQACHLSDIKPVNDPDTKKVVWEKAQRSSAVSGLNIYRPKRGTDSCQRCHYSGNNVAAAAMILPAKSIICMPCHAATFSARDVSSILALVGLALGMCAVASVWFTGAASRNSIPSADLQPAAQAPVFARVTAVLKALLLDGLFQRRLFLYSPQRWVIHGLIFWPFVVRFSWGVLALVGSLLWPGQAWVWHMLDKNYPLTAFVFDSTGLMIIFGVVLAIFHKRLTGGRVAVGGLPGRDWLAAGLLLGIVVVGFLLEGARIALTAATGGADYAFVGWALSFLWRGIAGLSEIYGYIWYSHAILTAAFLVYLPFSGMFHMIIAPVVMALNAADSHHGQQERQRH